VQIRPAKDLDMLYCCISNAMRSGNDVGAPKGVFR
jgi:hypothetical protein